MELPLLRIYDFKDLTDEAKREKLRPFLEKKQAIYIREEDLPVKDFYFPVRIVSFIDNQLYKVRHVQNKKREERLWFQNLSHLLVLCGK